MSDEIKRKHLSIDDTPDCYFHHKYNDEECKQCFCERECEMGCG